MAARNGILLAQDGDILIENGDLVIGDCTQQDTYINLNASPGDLKHAPLIGGMLKRATKMRATDFSTKLEPRIRESLSISGFSSKYINQVVEHIKAQVYGS